MKQRKLLALALFAMAFMISCGKDDDPSTPETKAPTITSLSKSSGPVGTVFEINGTNFSTTLSKNIVKIGAVNATVSAATTTKITTSVPEGAITAKVSVTVGGKTATSTDDFTVTLPQAANKAPTITTTNLSAAEDLQEGAEVGQVDATDDDGDVLTFSMTDESGTFVMDASTGTISLAEQKSLDFETTPEYTVTVGVADGKGGTDNKNITITITDVLEVDSLSFEIEEDVNDTDLIGSIMVSDATFSISLNDNDLFEITQDGKLSLADGKGLDFETQDEHSILILINDGQNEVEIEVVIIVLNILEDSERFITVWQTTINYEEIIIGTADEYQYDYEIDWGMV